MKTSRTRAIKATLLCFLTFDFSLFRSLKNDCIVIIFKRYFYLTSQPHGKAYSNLLHITDMFKETETVQTTLGCHSACHRYFSFIIGWRICLCPRKEKTKEIMYNL